MRKFKVYSTITGMHLADGVEYPDTSAEMSFPRLGITVPGPVGALAKFGVIADSRGYRVEWVD